MKEKGFTLTETAVSLAVMSVLVASASAIIMMAAGIFARNAAADRASDVGERLCRTLEDKLSCAVALQADRQEYPAIPEDMSAGYRECLVIGENGETVDILREQTGSQTVFDQNDLKGLKVKLDMQLAENGSDALTAKVLLTDDEGECKFSRTLTLPLLNMNGDNREDFTVGSLEENGQPLVISYGYIH